MNHAHELNWQNEKIIIITKDKKKTTGDGSAIMPAGQLNYLILYLYSHAMDFFFQFRALFVFAVLHPTRAHVIQKNENLFYIEYLNTFLSNLLLLVFCLKIASFSGQFH